MLIANGADVATVVGLLGHSQPSTTLDIYTHAFDKNKKAAAKQQAEVMRLHRRLEKKLDRRNQIQLLELIDAKARLRDDVSLESFTAVFRLACGIAHKLGAEPPYSFRQEEEQRISGA